MRPDELPRTIYSKLLVLLGTSESLLLQPARVSLKLSLTKDEDSFLKTRKIFDWKKKTMGPPIWATSSHAIRYALSVNNVTILEMPRSKPLNKGHSVLFFSVAVSLCSGRFGTVMASYRQWQPLKMNSRYLFRLNTNSTKHSVTTLVALSREK